jgi:hypothetical protein
VTFPIGPGGLAGLALSHGRALVWEQGESHWDETMGWDEYDWRWWVVDLRNAAVISTGALPLGKRVAGAAGPGGFLLTAASCPGIGTTVQRIGLDGVPAEATWLPGLHVQAAAGSGDRWLIASTVTARPGDHCVNVFDGGYGYLLDARVTRLAADGTVLDQEPLEPAFEYDAPTVQRVQGGFLVGQGISPVGCAEGIPTTRCGPSYGLRVGRFPSDRPLAEATWTRVVDGRPSRLEAADSRRGFVHIRPDNGWSTEAGTFVDP